MEKKNPRTRTRNLKKEASDGSTANYYELPEGATELQHLISYKNMNAQIGLTNPATIGADAEVPPISLR